MPSSWLPHSRAAQFTMSIQNKKQTEKDTKKGGELTDEVNAPPFGTYFTGYQPQVKPLGQAQGGGFRVSFNVSDSDWNNIAELNNPALQQMLFTVVIKGFTVK